MPSDPALFERMMASRPVDHAGHPGPRSRARKARPTARIANVLQHLASDRGEGGGGQQFADEPSPTRSEDNVNFTIVRCSDQPHWSCHWPRRRQLVHFRWRQLCTSLAAHHEL